MTNFELVERATKIAGLKTVYMWGVFGSVVTEELIMQKAKQYPSWYTAEKIKLFRSMVGKGYWAFDCVNLIKAILWGWNGDTKKNYGGAVYASNKVPDASADGFFKLCQNKTANFANIQVGDCVWMPGHIGIYIGNRKVIECSPKWKNGVQITALNNIGTVTGLNGRKWTQTGKNPFITYAVPADPLAEYKAILKTKAGLSDDTIKYLQAYQYGKELITKLANAMK